jgi:hypothetical protein
MRVKTIALMAAAAHLSACSALHPVPDSKDTLSDQYINEYAGSLDEKDSAAARQYINAASSFPSVTLKASGPDARIEDRNLYMQSGFSLANLYCSLYFQKLARDQAILEYHRTQISLASGLATGLMGIFQAGSAATGATGAALGFLGASVDNINTSFLLAPKIESLESLVIKAHTAFASNIKPEDYATFPQAQTLVNRYAGICTFRGLKDLVDQSVANAEATSAKGVVSINNPTSTQLQKSTDSAAPAPVAAPAVAPAPKAAP